MNGASHKSWTPLLSTLVSRKFWAPCLFGSHRFWSPGARLQCWLPVVAPVLKLSSGFVELLFTCLSIVKFASILFPLILQGRLLESSRFCEGVAWKIELRVCLRRLSFLWKDFPLFILVYILRCNLQCKRFVWFQKWLIVQVGRWAFSQRLARALIPKESSGNLVDTALWAKKWEETLHKNISPRLTIAERQRPIILEVIVSHERLAWWSAKLINKNKQIYLSSMQWCFGGLKLWQYQRNVYSGFETYIYAVSIWIKLVIIAIGHKLISGSYARARGTWLGTWRAVRAVSVHHQSQKNSKAT